MDLVDYTMVEDDRESGRWKPLKITAQMGEPLIHYEDGLHFDGLLSWGAYVQYRRERAEDTLPPISDPWALDFELPLAKWAVESEVGERVDPRLLTPWGEVWGWCASAVEADWLARGKMEYRKRPDINAYKRFTDAPKQHNSLGPLKAFDLAYPTLLAHELVWYALGDRDAIVDLLGNVSHLGKRSTTGMGRVLRWTVEAMGQDWSIERDGRLTRRMPVGWRAFESWPDNASVRAPYHHRSRRVPCIPMEAA